MRKTLATIVLALGLVFSFAPAMATEPTNLCGPHPTDTICPPPAPPAPCTVASPTCQPNLATIGQRSQASADGLAETVLRQGAVIERQHARITHQRALIKRLRHRLATR